MSGDAAANSSEPRKLLGLGWETHGDKLQVDVKLNTGGKVQGARVQEDIDLEGDLSKAIPGAITKRILWRVAQGQYDPLGLLCAFTIRFKIIMRGLSDEEEGAHIGWDDPVPASVESDFREVLEHLKDLKKSDFPPLHMAATRQRPGEREPHDAHLRRWIGGSQLSSGLPEVGVRGLVCSMPAPGRKNEGCPQV